MYYKRERYRQHKKCQWNVYQAANDSLTQTPLKFCHTFADYSRYRCNSPRYSRKPCSQQIFLCHILFSGNRQGHKKCKTIIKLIITYSRNGKNCCDNRKISCSKTDTPASCQIQDDFHYNNQDKKLFLLFHQFYILYK